MMLCSRMIDSCCGREPSCLSAVCGETRDTCGMRVTSVDVCADQVISKKPTMVKKIGVRYTAGALMVQTDA